GKYFSAGNTTTNKIESNWNQVKLLLGKRPRLDATISGLLAHQGTIGRQVLATMRKHVSTSRHPGAIPDFLTRWELSTRRNTYVCNDYEWTCRCLFYCSHHLPCQHLMFIADRVHRFEYLPESTVPQRWDM
ncbi:hypothetical protein PHYSODRAFT_411087, partial [Phytophthora sojae]